jgi:hypothetical protein
VIVQLAVVAGFVSGLLYLAVQVAKYFIGYFMPKTADRVDTWREKSFVRRTAQAIVDGEGYTAWEIERYVERRTPKLLSRPIDYGVMEGHPETLEFERIAAADRHARIVAAINARTREGLANRGA